MPEKTFGALTCIPYSITIWVFFHEQGVHQIDDFDLITAIDIWCLFSKITALLKNKIPIKYVDSIKKIK